MAQMILFYDPPHTLQHSDMSFLEARFDEIHWLYGPRARCDTIGDFMMHRLFTFLGGTDCMRFFSANQSPCIMDVAVLVRFAVWRHHHH